MLARLVFLGAVVQTINHARHHIGWNHIGALAADVATVLRIFHMLQLLENIESFQHYHQFIVQECANQTGIPYEVVGIQLLGRIFSARIEIEVVRQIQIPWQMEMRQQTELPVDRMRDGSIAVGVGLAESGAEGEYLFARLPFQSQVVIDAAHGCLLLQSRENIFVLGLLQTHLLLDSIRHVVVQEEIRARCERHSEYPLHLCTVVAVGIIVGIKLSSRRTVVRELVYDGVVGVLSDYLHLQLVAHVLAQIGVSKSSVHQPLRLKVAVTAIVVLCIGGDGYLLRLLYLRSCGGALEKQRQLMAQIVAAPLQIGILHVKRPITIGMTAVEIAPRIGAVDAVKSYRQEEIRIPDTQRIDVSPLQLVGELMIVVVLPLLVTVVAILGSGFCHFLVLAAVLILILHGRERAGSEPEIAELGVILGVVDRAGEETLTIIIGGVDGYIVVIYGLLRALVFPSAFVGAADICFQLLALVVKLDAGGGRNACRIAVALGGSYVPAVIDE